jgi:FkbM family methyltransferase
VKDRAEVYEALDRAYFSEEPHEQETLEHLPALLSDGALVVDVGASLGQYTKAISSYVRGSEIVAIEADPLRVEQLKRNCEKWNGENTIRAVHLALTDHAGRVPFFVTNSPYSGGLIEHDVPVEWEEIELQSSTLDDLFRDPPQLVKIDVEGAERRVLLGARKLLQTGRTNFLIELHDWAPEGEGPNDVIELMRGYRYRTVPFYGTHLFTRSRPLAVRVWAAQLRDLRRVARSLRNRLLRV